MHGILLSFWAGAPSCYLELLDKLQKAICRTVGPSLAAFLERLAHCRNVAYSILLACAGSVIYAIPSLLDIYTIDAHLIYFQFYNLIALSSLLEQCYILM